MIESNGATRAWQIVSKKSEGKNTANSLIMAKRSRISLNVQIFFSSPSLRNADHEEESIKSMIVARQRE